MKKFSLPFLVSLALIFVLFVSPNTAIASTEKSSTTSSKSTAQSGFMPAVLTALSDDPEPPEDWDLAPLMTVPGEFAPPVQGSATTGPWYENHCQDGKLIDGDSNDHVKICAQASFAMQNDGDGLKVTQWVLSVDSGLFHTSCSGTVSNPTWSGPQWWLVGKPSGTDAPPLGWTSTGNSFYGDGAPGDCGEVRNTSLAGPDSGRARVYVRPLIWYKDGSQQYHTFSFQICKGGPVFC